MECLRVGRALLPRQDIAGEVQQAGQGAAPSAVGDPRSTSTNHEEACSASSRLGREAVARLSRVEPIRSSLDSGESSYVEEQV